MQKDFRNWHAVKQAVHNEHPRVHFKEREIWFAHLGENVGYEQDGRGVAFLRPVIIIKKFNNDVFWAVPLTSHVKREHPYYFTFSFRPEKQSSAILSQVRLLDAKRLKYKTGYAPAEAFMKIKEQIRHLLA